MRYRDRKFTAFSVKDSLSSDSVNFLLEDSRGDLWIGANSGVSRLHAGRFMVYDARRGGLINFKDNKLLLTPPARTYPTATFAACTRTATASCGSAVTAVD